MSQRWQDTVVDTRLNAADSLPLTEVAGSLTPLVLLLLLPQQFGEAVRPTCSDFAKSCHSAIIATGFSQRTSQTTECSQCYHACRLYSQSIAAVMSLTAVGRAG